jgi:hypothetical protein
MHVLTQHYDNERSGANLQEKVLGPDTVDWKRFGTLLEQQSRRGCGELNFVATVRMSQ